MVKISRILNFLTWHVFDEFGWNGPIKCCCCLLIAKVNILEVALLHFQEGCFLDVTFIWYSVIFCQDNLIWWRQLEWLHIPNFFFKILFFINVKKDGLWTVLIIGYYSFWLKLKQNWGENFPEDLRFKMLLLADWKFAYQGWLQVVMLWVRSPGS